MTADIRRALAKVARAFLRLLRSAVMAYDATVMAGTQGKRNHIKRALLGPLLRR